MMHDSRMPSMGGIAPPGGDAVDNPMPSRPPGPWEVAQIIQRLRPLLAQALEADRLPLFQRFAANLGPELATAVFEALVAQGLLVPGAELRRPDDASYRVGTPLPEESQVDAGMGLTDTGMGQTPGWPMPPRRGY